MDREVRGEEAYLERHYQPKDPATVLNIKDLLRAGETEVYARGRDGRPALMKRERNLLDHLIKEDKLDAGIRLVKLEDANTVGGAGPHCYTCSLDRDGI